MIQENKNAILQNTAGFLKLSVQFSCSVVSDSLWPHESQHARPPCPSPTSRSSPKLMSNESVMPSSHLTLCCPLLLLPPIPPSIRVCSSESALHMRWPKYCSFIFSISPSNEHPGLISFRMDCWIHIAYCNGYLLLLTAWHPFCILVRAFKFSLGNRHTLTRVTCWPRPPSCLSSSN